ncbi:MAG: response regulator [Gammaproteobacteria bacterium]|nr:response regulator [Gammaproteobacteria bacterium]
MKSDLLLHILIIDDDEVDILAIQSCFRKLDIPVFFSIAKNGVEALHMLLEELKLLPQIIILDNKMPKMNGIEFLENLRADSRFNDIHVFMVTGLYSTKDKLATRDLNVAGRVVKPLSQDDALHMYMAALKLPGFQAR